jgi:hypothetical protein
MHLIRSVSVILRRDDLAPIFRSLCLSQGNAETVQVGREELRVGRKTKTKDLAGTDEFR